MIFSSINEAKEYVYNNFENITYEDVNSDGCYCYVFFSSNGICDEEPIEKYITALVDRDRYEWTSMANSIKQDKNTGRCIYIRDVYKNFYIHGISRSANSIEKTVEKIRLFTSDKDWKIVTVGISSGGYMATIVGMKLHAYKIYNISGQYNLTSRMPEDFTLFKENNGEYGNIVNMLKKYEGEVYYFCPVGCSHDKEQLNLVKEIECIRTFLFPDKIHAATVYPFNFPDLIMADKKQMDKLYLKYDGKLINKKLFLLQTMTLRGWKDFVLHTLNARFNVSKMKDIWDVKRDSDNQTTVKKMF